MRRKSRGKKESCEVNMGAFSDIAFQLIIFFIVAATFNKPMGQKLDLPTAEEPEQQAEESEDTTLTLSSADIRLSYGDRKDVPFSRGQLREWLAEQRYPEKEREDQRVVILQTERSVPYGRYFDIVNMLNNSGAIITIIQEEGGDE